MFGPPSAADQALLLLGVTLALDWDPRERDLRACSALAFGDGGEQI